MRRAERVVFAFRALGEAGQPAALAQGVDAVAAAREDFMRVALVPDIPDQAVFGCVENGMNGHGQFDHAQPRAEMPAGFGHGGDGFAAQFICKNFEIVIAEGFQIGRNVDAVEQGGVGFPVIASGARQSRRGSSVTGLLRRLCLLAMTFLLFFLWPRHSLCPSRQNVLRQILEDFGAAFENLQMRG